MKKYILSIILISLLVILGVNHITSINAQTQNQEEVMKQQLDQVGSGISQTSLLIPIENYYYHNFEISGYSYTGSKTSTGTIPKRGTIAADPRFIPYGTKLYVPGYGYGIVEDCGGSIKGYKLDLFFDTEEEATIWGRQYDVEVQIFKEGV